jgi:nucleoid-associated protein YgaU
MRKDVKTGILVGVALAISATLIISLLSQTIQNRKWANFTPAETSQGQNTIPESVILNDEEPSKIEESLEIEEPLEIEELSPQERDMYKVLQQSLEDINKSTGKSTESEKVKEPEKTPPPEPVVPKARIYVVKSGDTLSSIAEHYYGHSRHWRRIYEANKGVIPNFDALSVGTKLTIPQ